MTEIRPADVLDGWRRLPLGRFTVLPPAERPPPSDDYAWRPMTAVIQMVVEGELPLIDAGGGIVGPRLLRRGDVLVALAGSWSRRRYVDERRLLSLSCVPGLPWLDHYHFLPPRIPGGRGPTPVPLQVPRALAHAGDALAACSEPEAALDLARAMVGLMRRQAAIGPAQAAPGVLPRVRAWLANRDPAICSRSACAKALGLHPDHLTRALRQAGASWRDEMLGLRMQVASSRLLAGEEVATVAAICGYASASHFIGVFRRRYGLTPQRWRRRHDPDC